MYVVAHNGSAIFGGGEIGTVLLLRELQRRGHRVLMLFRDQALAARAAEYGIPTAVQLVGGDLMLPDALRMAARLRRERPDALILTSFKKVVLAGLAGRLAHVPRIVQRIVLQGDTPARGARYRWALRHLVDAIALNADAMRHDFLSGDAGLDARKVITIHDGVRVPVAAGQPGAVRAELGIPADAPVIGAVARLAWQKRFDRLVRALALLPSNVHCVVAGEGEETDGLRALAAQLGVSERLHLPGFRRDVGDMLAALDVFVVSSDREGLANAMLEAMATGIPVISTPVSGAEEALEPFPDVTRPGEIVAAEPEAIAATLRRLLDDPSARQTMGAAGRRRVAERFSAEAMVDAWEALLAGEPARQAPR
ncbi:MAG: glycosyltransferase [Gemmatimonadetes bacterium]|nr:glycosyltransferase [Gemmatimonadota bacterium]